MNKRIVLVAVLLVNVLGFVSGVNFMRRINEKYWINEYFNEIIYNQDRNLLMKYKLPIKWKVFFTDYSFDHNSFWFNTPNKYVRPLYCSDLGPGEYVYRIHMESQDYDCYIKEPYPDLYEVQIKDEEKLKELEKEKQYNMSNEPEIDVPDPKYNRYYRFDGDYLYIYLEDGKTLHETYCAYDKSEIEALEEAIRTNEFDMTKITFPRHADGTCDYESGRAVQGEKIVCGIYRTKKTLWLRKKAGSFGKVTTMKEGSYVKILAKGKKETINGITDNWVQVEVLLDSTNLFGKQINGAKGWCFGGYLK